MNETEDREGVGRGVGRRRGSGLKEQQKKTSEKNQRKKNEKRMKTQNMGVKRDRPSFESRHHGYGLTCDVQVEHGGVGAQVVLGAGRHAVDPHRLVHVPHSAVHGAHVGVGEGVAVAEVQRHAGAAAVALGDKHHGNREAVGMRSMRMLVRGPAFLPRAGKLDFFKGL